MTKPLVFNYKDYEELRQLCKQTLDDNQTLMADNRKLRKEVEELKRLNDGYVKIIAKNQETNNKLMASVAEPKWNCTANFVAEQLDRLRKMTDEEKWEFFKSFFEVKGGAE